MNVVSLPRRPDADDSQRTAALDRLRERIRRIESPPPGRGDAPGVLSLGAPEIDSALPWGGLPRAALHEIQGGDDGAATGFCAALLGRIAAERGAVVWCRRESGLYGPGLAAFGLDATRLIVVRARDAVEILWVMEECLRGRGVAAVLGETAAIAPTAARRLQLAAETGGTTALLLRSGLLRPGTDDSDVRSALTRWRATTASGVPRDGLPGLGRPRWRLDLLRCRRGAFAAPRAWLVEWHDDGTTGRLVVAAELRDRPAESATAHRIAV